MYFRASGYFGDFILYLVYISCLRQCGVFGLYPADQFISAGCDKSGEILCTGYPDAVPITYLGRIINVKLFGYNAYFDMILGVLSLGAGAAVLALYAERNRSVGYLSFLLIQFVYFSLNKWEMMTNGTGWVCTLSISGFLFHFAVLDHAAATRCRNMSDRVLLAILPILLVVLVAGPYSGGYAVILVLAYGALWLADRRGVLKQAAAPGAESAGEPGASGH